MDGNERLSRLATAVLLDLDGGDVAGVANDDVYEFVFWVAAGDHELTAIAAQLERLCPD